MSRQQERFEAMRSEATEKILLSAAKLFARKTFAKTTMQDIADDAGLSKGLAYRYFESKEALMRELAESAIHGVERMAALFRGPGTEREILTKATQFILDNLKEDPSSTDSLYLISQIDSFSEQELTRELKDALQGALSRLIDRLAGIIRAGQDHGHCRPGDPHRSALFYFSVFQGVAFASRTVPRDYVYPTADMFLAFLFPE